MSACFKNNKDLFHHLIMLNVIFIVNWQYAHVVMFGVSGLGEIFD